MAYVNRYVNRDEYDRKRHLAMIADSLMQDADEELIREKQKFKNLAKNREGMSAADLAAMEKKFNRESDRFQDELDSLREELGKQLGDQALNNQRALASIRRLTEDNKKELDSVSGKICELEKKISAQMAETAKQIESDRKQALYYYDQLSLTVKQMADLFPEKYEAIFPDKLQPGYYILQSTVECILDDIEQKDYEAAIALAQARIQEALNVLALLGYYHSDFINAQMKTREAMDAVLARVSKLEKPATKTLFIDAGVYSDGFGVSYWAKELYNETKALLKETERKFDDCVEAHDAEGILSVLQDIKAVEKQLDIDETIEANERRLHYACVERAAQIFETLKRNDEGSWKGRIRVSDTDLREPVYLTLTNEEGRMLIFICAPERKPNLTAQGSVRCELSVFDCDGKIEDNTRCRIIYEDIATVLTENGLSLHPKQEGKSEIGESSAFIDSTKLWEVQKLASWITTAKKAIGLLKED